MTGIAEERDQDGIFQVVYSHLFFPFISQARYREEWVDYRASPT